MRRMLMAAAALLLACAHHEAKVDDSGLARLNQQQMQPVDQARIDLGHAQDAVARARANEADARAQLEVTKSDREVAEAQLRRSTAERDLLKKQYAGTDAVVRAEQDARGAQDRVKAADVKTQYLGQLIALRESERKLAEAHVVTAQAMTEQTKLRAMQYANAPQASATNAGEIDQRVAKARGDETELQKQVADQRTKAFELYNQWERYDASARALARPSGTIPTPPPVSEPTTH